VSDVPVGALPSLAEARGWFALGLDDVDGRRVGRIDGIYADTESGEPVWLVVTFGRRGYGRFGFGRRRVKAVVVALRECAAMPGRAWTAQPREAMLSAPVVDPTKPLLREHEATICTHYGIGERVGRHADIGGRSQGSVTAQPA
jgi:hypothetical protein